MLKRLFGRGWQFSIKWRLFYYEEHHSAKSNFNATIGRYVCLKDAFAFSKHQITNLLHADPHSAPVTHSKHFLIRIE